MEVILLVNVVLLFFAAVFAHAEDLARCSTCARERLLHQRCTESAIPNKGLYREVRLARQAAKTQQ